MKQLKKVCLELVVAVVIFSATLLCQESPARETGGHKAMSSNHTTLNSNSADNRMIVVHGDCNGYHIQYTHYDLFLKSKEHATKAHKFLLQYQPNVRAASSLHYMKRTKSAEISFSKGASSMYILLAGENAADNFVLTLKKEYFNMKKLIDERDFVIISLDAKYYLTYTEILECSWSGEKDFDKIYAFMKTVYVVEFEESRHYVVMNPGSELILTMAKVSPGYWNWREYSAGGGGRGWLESEEYPMPAFITNPTNARFLNIRGDYGLFSTNIYSVHRQEVYWLGDKLIWGQVKHAINCKEVTMTRCAVFEVNITYKHTNSRCEYSLNVSKVGVEVYPCNLKIHLPGNSVYQTMVPYNYTSAYDLSPIEVSYLMYPNDGSLLVIVGRETKVLLCVVLLSHFMHSPSYKLLFTLS